jgi:beta-glucanase (GH16 family)
MRRALTLFCLLVLASPLASFAQSGWNLTFSDEFNSTSLNTTKWGTQYTWSCTNNDELEGYEAANVTEAGGLLTLTATHTTNSCDGGKSYSSGLIESSGKFSQLYGYFEARIQVPAFQGFWPAFWLMPANGAWPPEIDVIELGEGGDFTTARMTNHYGPSGSGSYDSQTWSNTGTAFGSALHVFAVDWEPGALDFYIDGTLRATITAPECPSSGSVGGSGNECVSAIPMYVLANLAVGGSYTGGVNQSTPFPSSMTIDHIRVYQHPASGAGCYASIPLPTDPIPSTTCSSTAAPEAPTGLAVTVQ